MKKLLIILLSFMSFSSSFALAAKQGSAVVSENEFEKSFERFKKNLNLVAQGKLGPTDEEIASKQNQEGKKCNEDYIKKHGDQPFNRLPKQEQERIRDEIPLVNRIILSIVFLSNPDSLLANNPETSRKEKNNCVIDLCDFLRSTDCIDETRNKLAQRARETLKKVETLKKRAMSFSTKTARQNKKTGCVGSFRKGCFSVFSERIAFLKKVISVLDNNDFKYFFDVPSNSPATVGKLLNSRNSQMRKKNKKGKRGKGKGKSKSKSKSKAKGESPFCQ